MAFDSTSGDVPGNAHWSEVLAPARGHQSSKQIAWGRKRTALETRDQDSDFILPFISSVSLAFFWPVSESYGPSPQNRDNHTNFIRLCGT